MGRRYSAILTHLGISHDGVDIQTPPDEKILAVSKADQIIIATPTDTHEDFIRLAVRHRKRVLCEKPLLTDMTKLDSLMEECREENAKLSMIFQYEEMVHRNMRGASYYNYYKHGNDGIFWDCIQIIGLAKNEVTLHETSPIWKCKINGFQLDIGYMDLAYVLFIKKWLAGANHDSHELFDIHLKTHEMATRAENVRH